MFKHLLQLRNKIFEDKFLFSSAIVFISSFIVNVLNYIFTISTARLVPVESYGEFTSLLSLLILFSVPSSAMGMYISREISSHGENQDLKKSFLHKIFSEIILLSFLLWLVFLVFVPFFSIFLKIELPLLLLFSLLLPLTMLASLQVGFLQGSHKFFNSSRLNIVAAISKLIISLILLNLGFSIYGILLALLLASLLNIFIERKIYSGMSFKLKGLKIGNTLSHIVSLTFFSTLYLAILGNLDILLAKHFLSSYDAGAYGALSTMGKIIIFVTGSFVTVMMPMVAGVAGTASVSENNTENNDLSAAKKLFKTSLLFMSFFGVLIVGFFNIFPAFSVHILFGTKYEIIANYIGLFSIAMLLMTLSIAFIYFFIAIKNKSFIYFLSAGLILEAGLLWYNHSSVGEFVESVVASSVFIFVFMIINYLYKK
jgi:O-antigen/teichoic acid export membrane protein